jgi:3-isopropylmalate dehydrogenase
MELEAETVESAVDQAINAGLRTPDIAAGGPSVSTEEMGKAVAELVAGS